MNNDKLTVSGFLLATGCMVIFAAWKFGDHSEVFKWAIGAWGFFSGLFGGLITGVAIGRAMSNNTDSKIPNGQ